MLNEAGSRAEAFMCPEYAFSFFVSSQLPRKPHAFLLVPDSTAAMVAVSSPRSASGISQKTEHEVSAASCSSSSVSIRWTCIR